MFSRITAQLPADGLLFHTLKGTETLSRPFVLTAELLATDARIDRHALLGKPVTFTLPTDGLMNALSPRYLNGKITRVAVRSQELSGTRYAVYELTVEPDLWPMKRDRNLRIFQSQTVPQIVQTLLKEYGVNVETRLAGSYRVWEYCVQYQESSLDFISRLMELEGIYYFFRHEADKHTLVLCDAPDQHPQAERLDAAGAAEPGVAGAGLGGRLRLAGPFCRPQPRRVLRAHPSGGVAGRAPQRQRVGHGHRHRAGLYLLHHQRAALQRQRRVSGDLGDL
jgi:type VI secretion system secreted protein VgrG